MKKVFIRNGFIALAVSLMSTTAAIAQQQETEREGLRDNAAARSQEVKEKRARLRQKITESKQNQEKLSDKRLTTCKTHEVKINEVISRRSASAVKHLTAFDKIRDNLEVFASRKNLDVSSLQLQKDTLYTKRQIASDAVATMRSQTFSCADTDAKNPGSIVKEVDKATMAALKDYRGALREYSQAVKQLAQKTETKEAN